MGAVVSTVRKPGVVTGPARRARFSVRCDQVTPELLSHVERVRREHRLIGVEVDCRSGFDEEAMDRLTQAAGAHKLVLQL